MELIPLSVITFDRIRSLARGAEDDAIIPTLPTKEEENKEVEMRAK